MAAGRRHSIKQNLPAVASVREAHGNHLRDQNICASGAVQPYSDLGEQRAAPTAARAHKATRQLEIFALRCIQLADRVAAGELKFLDAAEFAYDAAIGADLPNAIDVSGLIDRNVISGDDVVQATLAAAFANARRLA